MVFCSLNKYKIFILQMILRIYFVYTSFLPFITLNRKLKFLVFS